MSQLSTRELSTPRVFRPYGTITVNASTASGTTANALVVDTNAPNDWPILRIAVSGTLPVRVTMGGSAVATGTGSLLVLGETVELLDRGTATHVAVSCLSGTVDNVTLTTGLGV